MYQNVQDQLNQGQQFFGIAMQKAIVSDPAKALGQNVLQNEPQEVFAFFSAIAGFAGRAVYIFKSDIAVLIGDDIIFRDDAGV